MAHLGGVLTALAATSAFTATLAAVPRARQVSQQLEPSRLTTDNFLVQVPAALWPHGRRGLTGDETDPLINRSIWNDTWVNFTFWHPTGTVSNVYNGHVAWADVGFMNIGRLFGLSFIAYPGALMPLAVLGAVVVGMALKQTDGHARAEESPPVACPSELTAASQDIYRYWCTLCCMLPSFLVIGVPIILVYASFAWPQEVFTITVIISSAFVVMNGIYMVFFVPFVLTKMKHNMRMTAAEVLSNVTADAQQLVHHWVVFPNYGEDQDIVAAAIRSVAQSSLAKTQIGILLAMEEREGEQGREKAKQLTQMFDGSFRDFAVTFHPANLPNDPPGKASNVSHAFKWLAQHVSDQGHDPSKIVLTIADADSEFHVVYFEFLTRTFLSQVPERRNDFLWQSPVLHLKNYHRQPGPVIVGTMFTAMAEIASLADPNAIRFPYSTYSLTMALANEVGGWDAEWIAEDWHMGIKCFLLTLGRTAIEPVLLPTINYTPEADTWTGTVQARFSQAKRHALGFSDLAYYFMMLPLIFVRLSSGRHAGASLSDFWQLIFSGMPYLVKLVNVHVIIGIMGLYAFLDAILKKVMVVFLDRSISRLFDRTFFATTMFAVASCSLTIIVTFAFQALYRTMHGHLERPTSRWSAWMYQNIVAHTIMTGFCFLLCAPFYFISLAYAVWLAALKLLFSRTFVYEVAAKPSKESRLA